MREGHTYLQVRLTPGAQLRVVKATQRNPQVVDHGCVVVKIRLRIPQRAFAPLEPEAVVTVPDHFVQHAVEAEAADASAETATGEDTP
jgi:hypothetical protein